jgi:hypothetical protein
VIDPARFDLHHGKGSFLRLCAMLADPTDAYQRIGKVFGVTRQDIFGLAKKLGVDGTQRRHDRALRVRPHVINRLKNIRRRSKQ